MRTEMTSKRSQAELIRLLETGVREVGDIDLRRFFVTVQNPTVSGSPPEQIRAYVLVRFLPDGAPFCCGEPSCYSDVFRDEGALELADWLRRKMGLRHELTVELNVNAEYYDGISFTAFDDSRRG